MGPCKTDASDSELLQLSGGGSADPKHELPAKAHARVLVALQSLPRLTKENPPDAANLAEPLCARLLRMRDTIGVEDLKSERLAALVSLLVCQGSRRGAASCLSAEFASEDLTLESRMLILDALSEAAKDLSDGPPVVETAPPARPPHGQDPSRTFKTRCYL